MKSSRRASTDSFVNSAQSSGGFDRSKGSRETAPAVYVAAILHHGSRNSVAIGLKDSFSLLGSLLPPRLQRLERELGSDRLCRRSSGIPANDRSSSVCSLSQDHRMYRCTRFGDRYGRDTAGSVFDV